MVTDERKNAILSILNNDKVGDTFFNLYDRWRDESEYEDINEYGKVISNAIAKQFPNYSVKLVQSTKRPFGVKIEIMGKYKVHIYAKLKGGYISLCGCAA